MNKTLLILFIYLFVTIPSARADLLSEARPALRTEPITIQELLIFLDLDMFKYKLFLTKGSKLTFAFKDIKRDTYAFKHEITAERCGNYTLRLNFKKNEGFPSNPLSKENKSINYSLNWNYERVFSGTIQNPLYGYDNVYSIANAKDVGASLEPNNPLVEFYSWDKKTDREELVAKIFIKLEVSK